MYSSSNNIRKGYSLDISRPEIAPPSMAITKSGTSTKSEKSKKYVDLGEVALKPAQPVQDETVRIARPKSAKSQRSGKLVDISDEIAEAEKNVPKLYQFKSSVDLRREVADAELGINREDNQSQGSMYITRSPSTTSTPKPASDSTEKVSCFTMFFGCFRKRREPEKSYPVTHFDHRNSS
jgi:hypothetical protein